MAEIENQALFAEFLYSGVASLKSHPDYKRRRKRNEMQPPSLQFSESYLDKIAAQVGISSSTLKSWIGQTGLKYVPGRVEDGKLFGVLWVVLKHSDMPIDWLVNVLGATSIPVFDNPTPDWVKACLRKAKVLLPNDMFGTPDDSEIDQVVERLFPESGAAVTSADVPSARFAAAGEKRAHVQHNLPTRWSNLFVGRKATLDILNKWLHSASPLCLITGWAGMGKSTIALEAAYACLGEARGEAANLAAPWPQISCAIWISADLKGMSYNYFLDTIAYQLGKVELLGRSENDKQFVVRNALANFSKNGTILLVVDNLDTSDRDILFFLANLPHGTKAIMTSRDHEQSLFQNVSRDLFTIPVGGLDQEDALYYLSQEIQYRLAISTEERKRENLRELLQSDKDILLQLVDATNGNPKALSLSIAYIADDVIPVQAFVREVQTVGYSLTSLFEYLFGHTWERCHANVKKLWMALPMFQTPPDERSWAAAAGLSRREFHQAVDQMRAYSLISTERSDEQLYYRAHQTMVLYGEHKLQEDAEFQAEARARWVDYYLDFIESRLGYHNLGHIYWKCLPGSDITPVKKEWPNLYKLLKWCEETGNDQYLTAFMLRLSHFLSRISLPLRIEFGLKAAEAAGRLNLKLTEALFRIDTVGWANYEIGRMEDGLDQIEQGLAIVQDGNWETARPDERQERDDMRSLGIQFKARYYVEIKRLDVAQSLLEQAMAIPSSPVIQQRAWLLKGNLEMLNQNYEQAMISLEEANRVSLTYGGEKSIESFYLLGVAYIHLGQYEKAQEAFESFLYDRSKAHQIELIYYEYGMAQLLAAKKRTLDAINMLVSVLNRIHSWEPGIRIYPEVKMFHDRLLENFPTA
jgi:Predicted N-acetylglucosaminyl transferase